MTFTAALCCHHPPPFLFRHCRSLIFTEQKTSRVLSQLHSLPPPSLWAVFKEDCDYLCSLCAAGRLTPGQALTGIRGKCSCFWKVLEVLRRVERFSAASSWLLYDQKRLDGAVFNSFKEKMLIVGCPWKQVNCRDRNVLLAHNHLWLLMTCNVYLPPALALQAPKSRSLG